MTVHAPAERPRILAELAERPGRTAYEVAAALGYGKPDSRRINEIVRRLWNDGALVAGTAFRPALGRQARIYYIAPPGTRPRLTAETREQAERRRASNRASKARTRARAAGKPVRPRGVPHLTVLKTAAASLGRDSERAACRDAGPDLFFGPGSEWPKARAARVAQARAYCFACPIRLACLEVARANRETYGVWGAVDFETERGQRSRQATRPDVAASSRA
jgi:WhiB family transcriptional regulator, redox-sensing transcriptional regulator